MRQHGRPTRASASSTSWVTGKLYEKVYYRYNGPGGIEKLCHTADKYMPVIHDDAVDAAAAKTAMERASAKAKRRRGGSDVSSRTLSHVYEGANEKKPIIMRYPERRGLRFCTEKRMFFDRDETSAIAIAGLRRLELALARRLRATNRVPKKNSSE